MLSINELHHDYLLIAQMKAPVKRKCRLLTELLAETPNPWRVVGITQQALQIFIDNEFNRIPRMRINRAHLNDRNETYTHLFEFIYSDPSEWWSYYYDRDETILATSSENMSNAFSDILNFSEFSFYNEQENLFKNVGFSWSYSKNKEKPFLQKIASQSKCQNSMKGSDSF